MAVTAGGQAPVRHTVPRRTWVALTAFMAAALLVEAMIVVQMVAEPGGWRFGMDFAYYQALGQRWLADGTFYQPHQLAGPHVAGLLDQAPLADNLYPPLALALFIPSTFVPPPFWWLVPLALCSFALWSFRPAPWAWPLILTCLMWPKSLGSIAFGNTDMWIAAFMAAGLRWGWPALLIPIKPSMAPFAIAGANKRSWWLGLCGLTLLVLATWPLWMDYARAIANATIPLTYSLPGIPLIVLPLVAWFARERAPTIKPQREGPGP